MKGYLKLILSVVSLLYLCTGVHAQDTKAQEDRKARLEREIEIIEGVFSIRFYGIAIILGILLAVIYGCRRCKQFGLKEDDLFDGVLFIVPFSILCARLYYCIFSWDTYADDLLSILYIHTEPSSRRVN